MVVASFRERREEPDIGVAGSAAGPSRALFAAVVDVDVGLRDRTRAPNPDPDAAADAAGWTTCGRTTYGGAMTISAAAGTTLRPDVR